VLHKLLALLKLPPPYILVGHSMGGLYMLYYASRYPQEVAGILLLDATSADGPTPLPKEAIPILKKLGNPQNPSPENFLYNEMIGQLPSYIQMQQASPLQKNIPLIILSANRHCLPLAWTKKLMCMTLEQEENHQRQQKTMAKLSNQSKYQLVSGDHNVFFTPKGRQAVIDSIYELLNNSQK
jgi:pimeloyl-ACP methyl ester carboxylesterase